MSSLCMNNVVVQGNENWENVHCAAISAGSRSQRTYTSYDGRWCFEGDTRSYTYVIKCKKYYPKWFLNVLGMCFGVTIDGDISSSWCAY